MRRVEAEAIYGQGRDAVVEVLLALSAQNERLEARVEALTAKVVRQEGRVAELERQVKRSSRKCFAAAECRSAERAAQAWQGSVGPRGGRPGRA